MDGDIRRFILRLAQRQTLLRWRRGLWFWLALMSLLWGAMSLAAVISEVPQLAYYGLLLTALGSLPAFIAYPPTGEPLVELVRGIDSQAALESYLSQKDGPARALLRPRALHALRLALLDQAPRPMLPKAILAMLATGMALFILAQAFSLRAGYGISLGYPEKGLLKEPLRSEDTRPAADYRPEFSLLSPGDDTGEPSAAYARPSGASEARGGEELLRSPQRRPGNEPSDPGAAGAQDGGSAAGEGEADEGNGSGSGAGALGERGQEEEGTQAEGAARQFGYEGSGKALEASPLLDYRAVFEREFVERTGRESALGPNITPASAQDSISAFYGSFSRDLILKAPAESRVEELKAAWARLGDLAGGSQTP